MAKFDEHISCDSCGATPDVAELASDSNGIWWNCKDSDACKARYQNWRETAFATPGPSVFTRPPNADEYIANLRFGSPRG